MSKPHHHVFNAIQRRINVGVPLEAVLPALRDRGIVREGGRLESLIKRGGMKVLTGYLRNQDFDTFLAFVECVCAASGDPEMSRKVDWNVVESIRHVVKDFDERNRTEHCERVSAILERYQRPAAVMEMEEASTTTTAGVAGPPGGVTGLQAEFERMTTMVQKSGEQPPGEPPPRLIPLPHTQGTPAPETTLGTASALEEEGQGGFLSQEERGIRLVPRRLYGSDAERDIQEGREIEEELREEESGEEERGKEEREEERGQLRRILTEGEGQEQRVAMETTQALLAVETDHGIGVTSFPDLPYVSPPERVTFTSSDREARYSNSAWNFSISVPVGAVPEGSSITLTVGACYYGPFNIRENYEVATGFFCILADQPFLKELTVVMEHCLQLPHYYQKDASVLVLKADHQTVSGTGEFLFNPLANPELSAAEPTLSLRIKDFCILCGALERGKDPEQVDDDESSEDAPPPPLPVKLNVKKEKAPPLNTVKEPSSTTSQKASRAGRKRKSTSTAGRPPQCTTSSVSVKCQRLLEYTVLVYEPPLRDRDRQFQVCAFVCHNCSVAHMECRKQAVEILECSRLKQPLYAENFVFGTQRIVTFSLEGEGEGEGEGPGRGESEWTVVMKGTGSVTEEDVCVYRQPLCERQRSHLQQKLDLFVYPPRKIFEVNWATNWPPCRGLSARANIRGPCRLYSDGEGLFFTITASAGGYCYMHYQQQQQQQHQNFSVANREPSNKHKHPFAHHSSSIGSLYTSSRLSAEQRNQFAKELHLQAAAEGVLARFEDFCCLLTLKGQDVNGIECYAEGSLVEKIYQALLLWKRRRPTTRVGDLVDILSTGWENDAVSNIIALYADKES